MKLYKLKYALAIMTSAVITSSALAAEHPNRKIADDSFGLPSDCMNTIITKLKTRCNNDSKGSQREHACISGQNGAPDAGKGNYTFFQCFTTGDAQDWCYDLTVRDAANCKYTVSPEQ